MDIDVLLLGRAFGFVGSTVIVVSINQNKQLSETNSYKFVDKREVDVDDHRADNVVSGHAIPLLVEVSSLSIELVFNKRVSCFGKLTVEVGIHEQ